MSDPVAPPAAAPGAVVPAPAPGAVVPAADRANPFVAVGQLLSSVRSSTQPDQSDRPRATMRVPGLSSFSSLGRSCSATLGKR